MPICYLYDGYSEMLLLCVVFCKPRRSPASFMFAANRYPKVKRVSPARKVGSARCKGLFLRDGMGFEKFTESTVSKPFALFLSIYRTYLKAV